MLSERYQLIHQRVLRHELFRPNNLVQSGRGTGQHYLTPIESLLGRSSSTSNRAAGNNLVLVLGVLLQLQEGVYCLEDPSGQVPIQLQHAKVTNHSYVTEHSILLVEGQFHDGVLTAHRIGPPLQESRASALDAIQKQVAHPHFQTPRRRRRALAKHHVHVNNESPLQQQQKQEPAFVIVSDIPTDHPRALQQWEALLARYERQAHDDPAAPLPLFVILGPFYSGPSVRQQQQGADELLASIARYTRLAARAHFCLVPSVDVLGVLPWPAWRSSSHNNNKTVAHFHVVSNPCRLRWNGHEMVVFRYDLLPLLQQHSMTLPVADQHQPDHDDDDDDTDDAMNVHQEPPHPYSRLSQTILDQGHLVPVAGTPIYWNYNHALSLYPLPDCLVLSSSSGLHNEGCYTERYHDCRVVVPGSLAQQGTYALYRPDDEHDEHDEHDDKNSDTNDDDEDDQKEWTSSVKFVMMNDD